MRRDFVRILFSSVTMLAIAAVTQRAPCGTLPCDDVDVDSWNYGYCIGDRQTSATHWVPKTSDRELYREICIPKVKIAESTQNKCRILHLCKCKDTEVTRKFEVDSCLLKPVCAMVDVAFATEHCCFDQCGRVCCCHTCAGPQQSVPQCDFEVRRVRRCIAATANTVVCCPVETKCKFPQKTIHCKIEDSSCHVTAKGCKTEWKPKCCSVATGCATLTKTPTVHSVHVPSYLVPCCPIRCVSCSYKAVDADSTQDNAESDGMEQYQTSSAKSLPAESAYIERMDEAGQAQANTEALKSAAMAPTEASAERLPMPQTLEPAEQPKAASAPADKSKAAPAGTSAPAAEPKSETAAPPAHNKPQAPTGAPVLTPPKSNESK